MNEAAAKYAKDAIAWCRAADSWPVINRHEHPEQWEAWRQYFTGIGKVFSARQLGEGGAIDWGVPTMWPHEFDPANSPSVSISQRARLRVVEREDA